MLLPMNFHVLPMRNPYAFAQGEAASWPCSMRLQPSGRACPQQLAKQGAILQEWQARLAKSSATAVTALKRRLWQKGSGRKACGRPVPSQWRAAGPDGQTLMASEHPDQVETHEVPSCAHCQASLVGIEVVGMKNARCAIFRPIRIEVNGTSCRDKVAQRAGMRTKGPFLRGCRTPCNRPDGAHLGVILHQSASYSVERKTEIFADLVQHQVSEATVVEGFEQWTAALSQQRSGARDVTRG